MPLINFEYQPPFKAKCIPIQVYRVVFADDINDIEIELSVCPQFSLNDNCNSHKALSTLHTVRPASTFLRSGYCGRVGFANISTISLAKISEKGILFRKDNFGGKKSCLA